MKKVMCFGTFDGLHEGHLNFFEQSLRCGDELIVVVARDVNVKKYKGRIPMYNEVRRVKEIEKLEFVSKVILGDNNDKMKVVRDYSPEVICLGYDQEADDKKIREEFNCSVIRMEAYREDVFKSSLLNDGK